MKLPPTYTAAGSTPIQERWDLFMCNTCGAVVIDQTKHKDFHARVEPPTSSEPFGTAWPRTIPPTMRQYPRR